MFAWENSGFSIDASVRIALNGVQLRVYYQPLEHLLRYCARPPFALERLSVTRVASGQEAVCRDSKAAIARHVADYVGQVHGPDGFGRPRPSSQFPDMRGMAVHP